jgi:hypothetical protein
MTAEITLALVRDYSENATLRPSPLKLRYIPWQPFVCRPVDVYAKRIQDKIEMAWLLEQMSGEFRNQRAL